MWSPDQAKIKKTARSSLSRSLFRAPRRPGRETYTPSYRLAGNFSQPRDFFEFLFIYTARLRRQTAPRCRIRLHVIGPGGTRSIRFMKSARRCLGRTGLRVVANEDQIQDHKPLI